MKKIIVFAQMASLLFVVGLALAAKKPAPNDVLFVAQESKQMVSMNPQSGVITWYAPKDEVARQLLETIAQDNQKIAQLQGQVQFFQEFLGWSPHKADPEFKRFVAARQAALNKAKATAKANPKAK